jgi:AcrR family transcriptional regulator
LTRDGIVATAVELVRAEGLGRVTMRRLAQELDTGAASLYVYVRNTAELHAAVLDELLGAVDLGPVTASGDWRERLQQVLTSYAEVLFEYPGLAQAALVARPDGEHYLDLLEGVLALLAEGGAPAGQAAWGVDLLLHFATSTAAEHAPTDPRQSSPEVDRGPLAKALRASGRPHILAHGDDLLSGPPEARLGWGFRALINGVLDTPRPEGD